ncbi:MAG: acetyl-CoA carboxylase biotin carboxylase subunit [Dehalococcoidia bacterium]
MPTQSSVLSPHPFRKVLVANRGEIAVRVMQACAELGIGTVAVYSEADAGALHVRVADEAVCIGPAPAPQSYLNAEAIVAAALATRADAVHPGYGFLSENADFAQACRDAGLVFIGPAPEAIRTMGSKIAAKRLAASLGVPLLPGYDGASQDVQTLEAEAARIGYPVLIKASAGGGGRGMRVVPDPAEFREALESAKREARAAFGDDTVLLERYVARPRHVEIQIFGDMMGTVLYLGERECSIQRRHQKVIEEAPSPAVTPALRAEMGEAAVRLAAAIGYTGAGTVEFLLDEGGRFAFLEMNTRLQVEHGVTELVTGLDLVHLQLRVAAGEPLPFRQEDVHLRGHAIECRVYAEDAAAGFLPSTGTLAAFVPPEGAGVRNDIGVQTGDTVSSFYDAMLAKLLVVGPSRAAAVERAALALRRYDVRGVTTNIPLLLATMEHPEFRAGRTSTAFLDEYILPSLGREAVPADALIAAAVAGVSRANANPWHSGWRPTGALRTLSVRAGDASHDVLLRRTGPDTWTAEADGEITEVMPDGSAGGVALRRGGVLTCLRTTQRGDAVEVSAGGRDWLLSVEPPPDVEHTSHSTTARTGAKTITAPLTGVVVKVNVGEGDAVRAQQPLVVLEAMKMEHILAAPLDATVKRIIAKPGDLVQAGAVLVELGE